MTSKMRRNFSGSFSVRDRGNGAWQLRRNAPHPIDMYLRDAEQSAAHAFGNEQLADLGIEWSAEKVLLTFITGGRVGTVEAANALVHEPLAHLYASLPLPSFDAKARRFWHRVFTLARIPGVRFLLMLLARSAKR